VPDPALAAKIRLAYDDRVMAEYREVLARPKFGFAPEDVADVLAFLEGDGEPVTDSALVAGYRTPAICLSGSGRGREGDPGHRQYGALPCVCSRAVSVLTPAEP